MEGWEGIQPADLVALRQRVRRENLQLDTESTFYSGMLSTLHSGGPNFFMALRLGHFHNFGARFFFLTSYDNFSMMYFGQKNLT